MRKAGAEVEILAWDDFSVSWKRFDKVVLRSTWDYTERLPEFLSWCERTATQTELLNTADIVKWNTDKHYLADLARNKCPVVESVFIEPGQAADKFPDYAEYVRLVAERVALDLDVYEGDRHDFEELPEPYELAYLTARLERLRDRIKAEKDINVGEL